VRPLASFGVPNGVRISIGAGEENELLAASLQKAMQKELVCS
jgi:histidinol-phosphate/aromatic aminotransferase/cobyric acid decarboxylase-like protein